MTPIDAEQIRELLTCSDLADPRTIEVQTHLDAELRRLRAACGLDDTLPTSHDELLADLAAVFDTCNEDLESLALLHARFRNPVELAVRQVAEQVHCDERTLRRRQRHGYELLAQLLDAPTDANAPTPSDDRAAEPPGNLPCPPHRLIGREADLATVERLVAANPVVVLRGPAGVGKTRLALEIGHRLAAHFPDGAWFVALEHLDLPELLPLTVATVLRAADDTVTTDDPAALLHDRQALIILDRCEHVGPGVSALVADLADRAPGIRVVMTTRRVLGDDQHTSWPLTPLDVPPIGEERPEALPGYAGVVLFFERLQALQPSFAIDATNAKDVALLVRRLGGMPLALEVAAGCAAQLPLAVVGSRLAPSIARRTTFSAPAIDTPSSVRAAVELGLTGLPRAEHELLTNLAVFAGGFDLDVARAVCLDDPDDRVDMPRALANLVRGSLVISTYVGTGPRFRLLEVMRAYAEDMLLRSGAADRVRRRHGEYFAALAVASHEALQGEDVDAWMTRLAVEHANLGAALRWLRDSDPGLALRMVAHLAYYWQISGQLTTGRRSLDDALAGYDAAGLDPDSEDRLKALSAAGIMARSQSDFPAARRYLEAAMVMAREREEPTLLISTLRRLGNVAEEQGEREEAAALYRESADISEAIGDMRGLAYALTNLGILADHACRHVDALALHQRSLALLDARHDAWAASVVRSNLALALTQLGRWDESLTNYREALGTARELGDRIGIASILTTMSCVERMCGRPEQAWDCLREALPLVDDTGDRQKCAEWLEMASKLLVVTDQHGHAAEALGAADALRARWDIEIMPKDLPDRLVLEAALVERLGADRASAIRGAAATRRWQEVASEALTNGSIDARAG